LKYFGTDGIRGKAYDFITEEMSFRVGKSLNKFINRTNKIIIARDTRISGEMIVNNIKKGALLAGLDVYDMGVYATPILAFATIKSDCFGIMVTASHNPYHDNGIKVFNRGEKSLPLDEELIEDVIDNDIDLAGITPGKEIAIKNLIDDYFDLYEVFPINKKFNMGLDLANGATVKSGLKVLQKYADKCLVIGNDPNGININDDCGSTHLQKLQQLVKDNCLDLGIAFDGDGDRVLVIDDESDIIDGDLLIYIFAKYLKSQNLLNNNVVVLSKMSNLGIIKALNNLGIRVIQTEVGDKYIFKALADEEATLGGENSGHIINKVLLKSGDGVLNAWFLLKILNHYDVLLSSLKKEVSYYPDSLVNIRNIDKSIVKDEDIISLVKHYQNLLGEDGKVLVRASGTEPLIRISVSASKKSTVDEITNELVNAIKNKGKVE